MRSIDDLLGGGLFEGGLLEVAGESSSGTGGSEGDVVNWRKAVLLFKVLAGCFRDWRAAVLMN
jgi:hypothetical protein